MTTFPTTSFSCCKIPYIFALEMQNLNLQLTKFGVDHSTVQNVSRGSLNLFEAKARMLLCSDIVLEYLEKD